MGRAEFDDLCDAAFGVFDTDENELVDALEFLATFAVCSATRPRFKFKFVFDAYDFDESGVPVGSCLV